MKTKNLAVFLICAAIGAINCLGQDQTNTGRIGLDNVPLTTAIDMLARRAWTNFIVDPKLSFPFKDSSGKVVPEPTVTDHWDNISPKVVLERLLKEHGLVVVSDPLTTVARITYTNQFVAPVGADLLDNETNAIAPLIKMVDVPLDIALEHLIQYSQMKVVVDPKLDSSFKVSVTWKNLTTKQAVLAVCENYRLTIVKDASTGEITIKGNQSVTSATGF